jgi:hypothetical protein
MRLLLGSHSLQREPVYQAAAWEREMNRESRLTTEERLEAVFSLPM